MQFNVNDIKVKDLNGHVFPDIPLAQAVGNAIYSFSRTIEWIEPSKAIHAGEVVELNEDQLAYVRALMQAPEINMLAMVKDAVIGYINELLTNQK